MTSLNSLWMIKKITQVTKAIKMVANGLFSPNICTKKSLGEGRVMGNKIPISTIAIKNHKLKKPPLLF